MTDVATAKAALLNHLDAMDAKGGYDDEGFATLNSLVDALCPLTPEPAPINAPAMVDGPWETVFAHFGAKHSAGKTRRHMADLKVHSFGNFPPVPVEILAMHQEIASTSHAYNNVVSFEIAENRVPGVIIIHGEYSGDDSNPQRFHVAFTKAELRPGAGVSEAAFRTALGFAEADPLVKDFRPPRLSSDIVYLDDSWRINKGSMGGVYVLKRSAAPAVSI
jgi:hypothetical protein